MLDKILVALDGSPFSDRALGYAIDLAKKYGSRLTLFHVVVRPLHVYGNEGIVLAEPTEKRLEEEGHEILGKGKERADGEGVTSDTQMVMGDPSEEIIKKAKEESYGLVVIGSRGLSRVKAFLLGSVSDRVSHYARCPVLIVKPPPEET